MILPPALRAKCLHRFEELIDEATSIKGEAELVPGRTTESWVRPGQVTRRPDTYRLDRERFIKWKTNCISLLAQVVPEGHRHQATVATFQKSVVGYNQLLWAIGSLKGLEDDLDEDLLGDLTAAIEREISEDYLGKAEELLNGMEPASSRAVAGTIAGIALERGLRRLCLEQTPPKPDVEIDGRPKRLNLLIDEVKKAGMINETKAKQLRAWAALRNHAAHGEYDQFTVNDVKQMIVGVKAFLEEYS